MCVGADETYMRVALEVARSKGSAPSTSPLGCVIVPDGKVIAAERNQTQELPDRTAHAEMMAIRRACETTGEMELRGATLYSTLKHCGMCTMESIWVKVGRVIYGAGRGMCIPCTSRRSMSTLWPSSAMPIVTTLRIEGGCLAEECASPHYGPNANLPANEQANL